MKIMVQRYHLYVEYYDDNEYDENYEYIQQYNGAIGQGIYIFILWFYEVYSVICM